MRRSLRSLPLLLVVAIAGCSQQASSAGDFKGAEKDVADTIEELQAAAQSRKPADICSEVLARALVDKVKTSGGGDCVDEMEKVVGDADDFELDVDAVTITGATATARVKSRRDGKDGALTNYRLAREDGKWRLSDFGAR
jgi:hypothetical protein